MVYVLFVLSMPYFNRNVMLTKLYEIFFSITRMLGVYCNHSFRGVTTGASKTQVIYTLLWSRLWTCWMDLA